jgi:MFS family permease
VQAGDVTSRDNYRWHVLAVVLLADLAFGSTMTILGASLGEVADDLDASESLIAWTLTAPFLAVAIGTPIFGKLGDLYGLRRVFLIGLSVFTVATLMSAVAPTALILVALRAIGGLGAAASLPTGLAMILQVFTVPERPTALGWFHMVATGGPAIGLITGGLLIEAFGWPVVFVVYGLIAGVGLLASVFVLRPVPGQPNATVDAKGASLLASSTLALMIAITSIGSRGLLDPVPLLLITLSGIGLFAFARVESKVADPLIPLRYLKRPNFSAPLVTSASLNGAYLGGLIITPLILQDVFGFSLSAATAVLIIRPLVFSASSPLGGLTTRRRGPRYSAQLGSVAMLASMTLFTMGAAFENLPLLLVGLAMSGLSLGLEAPAVNTSIANTVDDRDLGVANGVAATSSTLGAVLGLQLYLLVLGSSDPHGATDFPPAYAVGIALGVIALLAARAMKPVHRA